MFQTDQSTAATSLPTPAAAGTQGFFTNGNPGTGVPATIVDADWLNMTMLELCNIVTAAGMALSKTTYNQVLSAIKRIGQNTVVLADTGAVNAYTAVNAVPLVAGGSPTWVDGVVQAVKIAHTNTGASTYAPDGLTAIPIYGLGLQPLQGSELLLNGTAILMHATIAGVNSGNPICVLMECAGGAQQIPAATQPLHAMQLGQAVGRLLNVQTFTSSGTYTPTAGTTKVKVTCVGGGGGGGGTGATSSTLSASAGGGAGGSCAIGLYSNTVSQTVTVGAAGLASGASSASGGSGGTSSFGSLISANGGTGGAGSAGVTTAAIPGIQGGGGTPGTLPTLGNIFNGQGAAGSVGITFQLTNGNGGSGGASLLGGGAQGAANAPGASATTKGSGGAGACAYPSSPAVSGGGGAAGVVIVEEYA